MLDEQQLELFAQEIAAANGITLEEARDYAWRIGDTPELDETGTFTIISDEFGREIPRIIVPTSDE